MPCLGPALLPFVPSVVAPLFGVGYSAVGAEVSAHKRHPPQNFLSRAPSVSRIFHNFAESNY